MGAERSTFDNPKITLDLELHSYLIEFVDQDALRAEVTGDLNSILSILGIPGDALVDIITNRNSSGEVEKLLDITIAGQRSTPGIEILRNAYYFVTGDTVQDSRVTNVLVLSLSRLKPAQITNFIRLVTSEIIKSSPATLLSNESLKKYTDELTINTNGGINADPHWLQTILSPIINMHISISNRPLIEDILKESINQEKSAESITEDLIAILRPDIIEVQMPRAYLKQITLEASDNENQVFSLVRDGLFYELGIRFPSYNFVANEDLEPSCFSFKINSLTTTPVRGLNVGEYLVNEEPHRLGLLRIDGRTAINPANGSINSIISAKDVHLAEAAGLTTWDPMRYLILAFSNVLRTYSALFFDREVLDGYLEQLDSAFPKLVESARSRISTTLMTQTLRLLLAEGISIRDQHRILQTMIDLDGHGPVNITYDSTTGKYARPNENWFTDPVNLATIIRIRISDYISHLYQQRENTLVVYLLDPQIEALLANNSSKAISPRLADIKLNDRKRILAAVRSEFHSLPMTSQQPIILTTSGVRSILRELIKLEFPKVAVLSYHELAPDFNIEPVGRILLN